MHSFDNKPTKEFKKRVPQQTHGRDPYAGIRQMSSLMGNQAMLAMLRAQNQEGVGGTPFFDEIRAKFGQTRKPEDPAQKPARQSTGGVSLPDHLREKFEKKSGLPMDDVRVHYNSDKPEQLDALAYTQGTDVFVGPGKESSLPHELTHVIQQKQGIVQPTRSIGAYNINDSPHLEQDAEAQYIGRYYNRDASLQDQGVIQCDWGDKYATPKEGPKKFQKPINKENDQFLAAAFDAIRERIDKLQEKKKLLIYITVGTANKSANGTNPSVVNGIPDNIMEEKLEYQRHPGLLGDAAAEGYQVITIHIDDFESNTEEGNPNDFYINGLFPLSGEVEEIEESGEVKRSNDSQSICKIKKFISDFSQGDNRVVLVNAVEDSEENENDFRLFKGMDLVLPKGKSFLQNFTYATSYIQKQYGKSSSFDKPVRFNLYKNVNVAKGMYLQNRDVELKSLRDIYLPT